MIRLFEVLLHAGTTLGGWSTKQIHESVIGQFGLKHESYPMSSVNYDLRKLKGHGLVERDNGKYRYRLTEKGQRVAVLFLMFHQRLCGPLAGSQFGHRPNQLHRPKISKLEQAYYEADKCIDKQRPEWRAGGWRTGARGGGVVSPASARTNTGLE